MKFEGISFYIVIEDLKVVVNVFVMLECLFLVKGESGIGKIELVL